MCYQSEVERRNMKYVSDEATLEKIGKAAKFLCGNGKFGLLLYGTVGSGKTTLAKAFRSRTELRDPHANYNKMSMEEVKKNYPTFNWDAYLSGLGLTDVKEIIVGQPASVAEAANILNTLPVDQQALYLQWKLIDSAAGYLNDEMAQQNFDFYERTMSGTQEMQPRWKTAVSVVSSALGEAVGRKTVFREHSTGARMQLSLWRIHP